MIPVKVTRYASLYFLVQGLGVLVWWYLLLTNDSVLKLFQMGSDGATLMSFQLPDMAFLGGGSLLAALLCYLRSQYMAYVAWFVAGLVTYATFYAFNFALLTDTGWLGVVFMVPATIWSGVYAIGVSSLGHTMFRPSATSDAGRVLLKTFSQIVVVWTMILGVMPYLITLVEPKIGLPQLEIPFQTPISVLLFVLASVPGVWSAIEMSKKGGGTPLPLDHATKFVVSGPYAYVRNPMAVSGILQGLVVALFWGSALVAIYALMGSAVWQTIFRPHEEVDLAARFGEEFNRYIKAVKCWVPRLKPYVDEG